MSFEIKKNICFNWFVFYPYKKDISVDQMLVHWQLIFFHQHFLAVKKIVKTFLPLLEHHLEWCSVTNWLLRCEHLNSQLLTKHILGYSSLKYQMFFFPQILFLLKKKLSFFLCQSSGMMLSHKVTAEVWTPKQSALD